MVGRAKGTHVEHRLAVEQAGHAVDLGDLDRLSERRLGKDRRDPHRQHGLSRARRPDQKQIVASCGRDLERTLGELLPADFRQIEGRPGRLQKGATRVDPTRLEGDRAADEFYGLAERSDSVNLHAGNQRRLARVRHGKHEPAQAAGGGGIGDRQRSANGLDPSVERELAEYHVLGEALAWHLPRRGEQTERDR